MICFCTNGQKQSIWGKCIFNVDSLYQWGKLSFSIWINNLEASRVQVLSVEYRRRAVPWASIRGSYGYEIGMEDLTRDASRLLIHILKPAVTFVLSDRWFLKLKNLDLIVITKAIYWYNINLSPTVSKHSKHLQSHAHNRKSSTCKTSYREIRFQSPETEHHLTDETPWIKN